MDTEEVCRRYRPMVVHLAGHLAREDGELFEDLTQEGFLGLLGAWQQYRAERGVQFSTFAWRRVRGAMLNYLRDQHPLIRRARGTPLSEPHPYCVTREDLEPGDTTTPDLPRRVVLLEALSKLPERRRQWVLRVVVDEVSVSVLAAEAHVSSRYVRKEVARGLRDLRRFLES